MGFAIQQLQQAVNNLPLYIQRSYPYTGTSYTTVFKMNVDFTELSVLHVIFKIRVSGSTGFWRIYIDDVLKDNDGGQADDSQQLSAIDTSAIIGVKNFYIQVANGDVAESTHLQDLSIYQKL